jgi:hypothetical protein
MTFPQKKPFQTPQKNSDKKKMRITVLIQLMMDQGPPWTLRTNETPKSKLPGPWQGTGSEDASDTEERM